MRDDSQVSRQLMQKGAESRRAARRKDEMCHGQVEGNGVTEKTLILILLSGNWKLMWSQDTEDTK